MTSVLLSLVEQMSVYFRVEGGGGAGRNARHCQRWRTGREEVRAGLTLWEPCRQLHWTHLFPWAAFICLSVRRSTLLYRRTAENHLQHPAACAVPFLPETACRLLANFTLADIARLWLSFPASVLGEMFRLVASCTSAVFKLLLVLLWQAVSGGRFLKPGLKSHQAHQGTGGGGIIGIRASCSQRCAGVGRQRVLGRGHLSWTLRKYVLLYVAVWKIILGPY